jgi:AraC-like DNA-binding protein
LYAENAMKKIAVLDHLLLQQLGEQQQACNVIHHATDYLIMNQGAEALVELLKELKLTERTFQRLFKKYVGITPNQYRRICQFKSSFNQIRSGEFDKLSDVAFQSGFADQSHFNRSFKEFTEITPKDYAKSGLKRKRI